MNEPSAQFYGSKFNVTDVFATAGSDQDEFTHNCPPTCWRIDWPERQAMLGERQRNRAQHEAAGKGQDILTGFTSSFFGPIVGLKPTAKKARRRAVSKLPSGNERTKLRRRVGGADELAESLRLGHQYVRRQYRHRHRRQNWRSIVAKRLCSVSRLALAVYQRQLAESEFGAEHWCYCC